MVQTSVRMYIVWWCMQVRNIFGLKYIFTAITGNDLSAFCANVYVYMHSDLSVVCKCANTQKIMYLSLHCWCVCRYINQYKISKHVHVCKTHYYTNCYVSYFSCWCAWHYVNMPTFCWCEVRLACWFFFFNCDTLGVQVIHVINLYHYNDKNHDWINWKKKKSEILFLEFSNCNYQPFEISYIFMLQFWHFKFGILSHN